MGQISLLGVGETSLVLGLPLESAPWGEHSCCAHRQDGVFRPALLEASMNWEALHKPMKFGAFPPTFGKPFCIHCPNRNRLLNSPAHVKQFTVATQADMLLLTRPGRVSCPVEIPPCAALGGRTRSLHSTDERERSSTLGEMRKSTHLSLRGYECP